MATARTAWGIDIGNRALKAIKLVRDGDTLRVDDFDCIEHETVLSNSGDNREALVIQAIKTFAERHPTKGSAVSVGVSGQSSFARFIKLPPVEEKKIPEIVRFEAIQQIPFPLDDVEWSYQLFRPAESADVEVGIFAMRKELINQHIKYFTDNDLNVQVVQMNPLADYNAMFFDQRIDGTTMIIDLGAENTDLIIADSETVWLRSIPIGGNNFTETLVKSFKLNFAKAEDLKRNAATSKYARQIFQAMRPVFADLVAEVQRSIGFYASVHRDSRIKKILAVGGTFKLPGLQKYLQQNLQLEVERLDTFGGGAPADPKQAAPFQDNVLSLVSAYGLALQAMGEGKITSSLLPQHIRRARLWQEKQKYFAAAAALFVLGTGIGFMSVQLGQMKFAGAEDARSSLQQIESQAKDLDGKWTAIQGSGAADRQRILNIRSLTQYRDLFTNILIDLHDAVPTLKEPLNQIKNVPRNQRKQMFIDNIVTRYVPDMSLVGDLSQYGGAAGQQPGGVVPGVIPNMMSSAPDMGMGMMGMDPGMAPPPPGVEGAAPAAGAGQRGYVITLYGTTPYADAASFIDQSFVKALLSKHGKDKAPADAVYVIDQIKPVSLIPMERSPRLQTIKQNFDTAARAKESGAYTPTGGGGYGGSNIPGAMGDGLRGMEGGMMPADIGMMPGAGSAMAPGTAPPAEDRSLKDRVFPDESILQDQEFVIVMTVLVEPPPKPAGEGGAAPAEGAAPAAPDAAAPAAPAAGDAAPPANPNVPAAPAPPSDPPAPPA